MELIGKRFGRLIVLEYISKEKYRVKCDCCSMLR